MGDFSSSIPGKQGLFLILSCVMFGCDAACVMRRVMVKEFRGLYKNSRSI